MFTAMEARASPARTSDATCGDNAGAVPSGCFLDAGGTWRPFQSTYDAWFEHRGVKHYGTAAIEAMAFMTFGTAYYWLRSDLNRADWDRPSLLGRFDMSAVRFDNNESLTNHVLHPIAGAAYYNSGRLNGLSVFESFLYATVGSALWEWALEWRELVSINDMIITPLGGTALGELLYDLGEYANTGPEGSFAHGVARSTVGLPAYLHRLGGRQVAHPPLPPDRLGFSSAYSTRFGLGYELVFAENDLADHGRLQGFLVGARIVSIPGYERPGSFDLWFDEGNISEGGLRVAFDEEGAYADFDLDASTVLFGYYAQDFAPAPGGITGQGATLGLDTALHFLNHDILDRTEQIAIVHLFGPSWETTLKRAGLGLRLRAEAHADFGALESHALGPWSLAGDVSGIKSVLRDKRYQFHLGGSTDVGAAASWGPMEVGGSASYGEYTSLEGLDRLERSVTRDVHGIERVHKRAAWLGLSVPHLPVTMRLSAERFARYSRLDTVSERRWDDRYALYLGIQP